MRGLCNRPPPFFRRRRKSLRGGARTKSAPSCGAGAIDAAARERLRIALSKLLPDSGITPACSLLFAGRHDVILLPPQPSICEGRGMRGSRKQRPVWSPALSSRP
nr:MAG TPA: hypothetical protein [Caudoviricetes sp.]